MAQTHPDLPHRSSSGFDASELAEATRASLQDSGSPLSNTTGLGLNEEEEFERARLASLQDVGQMIGGEGIGRGGSGFDEAEMDRAIRESLNDAPAGGGSGSAHETPNVFAGAVGAVSPPPSYVSPPPTTPLTFPEPSIPPALPPRSEFDVHRAASIASASDPGDAALFHETASHLERPTPPPSPKPHEREPVARDAIPAGTSASASGGGGGMKEENKIGVAAAFEAIRKMMKDFDSAEAQERGKNILDHVVGVGKEVYKAQKEHAAKTLAQGSGSGNGGAGSTSRAASGTGTERSTWQEKLVGMAMSEAAKLFDKQHASTSAAGSTSASASTSGKAKREAIQSAAKTLLRLLDQLPKDKPAGSATGSGTGASGSKTSVKDLLAMAQKLAKFIPTDGATKKIYRNANPREMLYSVVSGVASTAVSFIPFVGSRSSTPTKQRLQAPTNSDPQGEEDENASSATLYKAPVPPNALATHQSTSLVLHRLATTSPLLPVQLAELITALSIAARVSLRASALFAEAILEGARVGTGTGMGLSRRAIIAALGSARWMREITAGGTNGGEEDKFLQVLDHYTNLGIYMVHHAFTLGELFTMSGFYLASSTVSFSFAAGEESVRMLDSLFGSNETSRALSAFITLLGREMNSGKFGEMRGILGTGRKFFALTKSLTVWACLQSVTHRRTVKGMKMRVLWDCTVCERQNLVTSPEGREEGHEMEKKERERLISDVRSAKEFGRTWRDEMTESKREKRLSLAPTLSRATTTSTIRSRPETELGNPINAGDEGEEGEIVFELMQLIGDDDESEVKMEDLPHDVREAIERLERGDETGLEVVKRGKGMDG
ncbi:hypothetical protein BT69DRAFT_1315303, partial [Atractiella rhizophila]